MPKRRVVKKIDGVVHRYNVPKKFRVGTRKSGTSAHLMSNEQLLTNPNVKAKSKLAKVAKLRGITV